MKCRSAGATALIVGLLAMTALVATALTTGTADARADPGSLSSHPQAGPAAGSVQDAQAELTGDIAFSVPSRTFSGELSVALSTTVPGAEIRYTTDGRVPGPESKIYPGTPLRLTATTQLRARPYLAGAAAGAPGTALYLASEVTTRHDLPVVVLDVYGAGKPKDEYLDTAIMTFEPGTGTTAPAGVPTLASRAGIHLRGQSSAQFPKPAYRLELRGNQDQDAEYPLLGMPADADWALRSPYFDKSLVREAFTTSLGQQMGRLKAPRTAFCELYLNLDGGPLSAADYQGVYLASELIAISDDRLDLAKLKAGDLTPPAIEGGYVFKFDQAVAEEPLLKCAGPASTCWNWLEVVEPDPLQPAQRDWLTTYVQRFHDVLHSADFADPTTGYAAWIDVPSFVDYVIVNEFSRNLDSYMRSAYFHKDRGGKLVAGPLWDYDLSWGTGGLRGNLSIQGWQYQEQYRAQRAHDWFSRLFQDPAFVERVAARWRELRQGTLSDAALDARMRELTEPLTAGADRNFQKWPILTRSRLVNWVTTPTADTWRGQLDYTLDWMHQRAAWLDTQWR